jgi:hypothetical protein
MRILEYDAVIYTLKREAVSPRETQVLVSPIILQTAEGPVATVSRSLVLVSVGEPMDTATLISKVSH